ncbi:MAG: hypothetical protein AABZ02_09460, partial [Bacteroidota bacterium]
AASEGGYRVPLYPILPGFFVLFLLTIAVNVILSQPGSIIMGMIILLVGYPIFRIMRRVTVIVNSRFEEAKEIPL